MKEGREMDLVRNQNEWEQYVLRVSMLGSISGISYPNATEIRNQNNNNNNNNQSHHSNKHSSIAFNHNNVQSAKKTKAKHFLQLIQSEDSAQNNNTSNGVNKQQLISEVMSNLSTCSMIDTQMTMLLDEMEEEMTKWEKVRREEIAKFRLNEVWENDNGNGRSEINRQAIKFIQMNHSLQDDDELEGEIKMEKFVEANNNQREQQQYHRNDRLHEFERENQLYLETDNHNKSKHLKDNDDIEI